MLNANVRFKPSVVFAAALLTLSSYAGAEEALDAQEREQALINAMPELQQESKPSDDAVRSGSSTMSCYVDTPAFDQFTVGSCFSVGSAFMTTAVFRIDNPPANFTILWSDSRCSSTSTHCFLPIRQYQTINLSATVLNNSNNTFQNVSATARYEGFF